MHGMAPESMRRIPVSLVLAMGLLLGAGWLLFTTSLNPHELLLGGVSVLLSTLFLVALHRGESQHFDLRLADVLSLWRTPWYVIGSSWEIVYVLVRDLAGVERAPSFYRVCGFNTSKHDRLLVTRSALAIAYTSVAPNFIVLGIDYRTSRMLFHQIRRSKVPQMTKDLGARISSDPSRHPAPEGSGRL